MSSKRGGHQVGERRVWRLCRDQQVFSAAVRKGRSHKTPGPAVHDDHVQRDFTATNPDEVWLTDVTEHPTAEGKLHACVIKDVCSNRIVGYAIGERTTARLAIAALLLAVVRRQPVGTVIIHSDCGGQGGSRSFRDALVDNGLQGSMGRVASAGDTGKVSIARCMSIATRTVVIRCSDEDRSPRGGWLGCAENSDEEAD